MRALRYYWRLIGLALSHSLDIAQSVVFLLLIGAGVTALVMPSAKRILEHFNLGSWEIGVAVLFVIFAVRIAAAPWWLHANQERKLIAVERLLSEISEERPFTFATISCHAVGNNFHTTPTWEIRRLELVFQNLSTRLLKFTVVAFAVECGGNRSDVQISNEAGTFIHGEQQMTYGVDVAGIATSTFPFVLTVSFDVHYDNVPPIVTRGSRRKVRYTIQSFRPVVAHNLILEQDEYRVGSS